ncbi:MAG: hypothetical protein SOZ59_13040, partial [Candidatus Limivivens sp.]|nr:hypothetical protein [Candidatus Limivivens sp.]
TEAPTEPVTEAPTEPVTEAPTEPVTEAPTEPVTEAPTEPVTEAPTEPVTEAPTEPVTEAPTEPMTEAPQTETQDTEPPTETETESETESETEPETSPMGNVKAYSKLNYKSKPYKGEGTKEDPYVFFCKDGAVVKASFMNMVLGFVSDGTTKKDGGFRKDGEGSYVVLEIREGDDVTGGFIKGIQINGTRKNDSSYDPSTSWIFTCDGLEKETEEVTEPDTVDTEPDTGWDDPGWDDPGWDDPGWDDPGTDVYTVSELKEAISQKEEEIRELELEIRSADLRVQQAQRKVDEAMVKATLNGVVKEVGDPEIGDIDGEAFITVTSNSGMYVKGTVSELELSQVKVGSIITGTSGDSYVSFEAEITEISEYPTSSSDYYYYGDSNPNVSYYPFTAYIDDAEGIRNNEWAELTIQGSGEDTSESLYIDKRYIRSENGQSYVYKAGSDNKLEKQYIKTGQTLYSQYVEIKQGLSLTDSIAFPYGKNVYEGAPVKTEEDGYPADEGENFDDDLSSSYDLNSMDEYGEDYDDYDYSDELGGFEDLDDGTFFDDEVSYDDMDVLE